MPKGPGRTSGSWRSVRRGTCCLPGERRAFLEIVFPLLEVLRDSYDPDYALHRLESFAAASGNRVSFLRALASRRPHLARISNLLALSNLGHQILTRHPEYFDSLARGIHLHEGRECAEMSDELAERLGTAPAGQELDVLRRYRQREMIRIAYRDLAELARAPAHQPGTERPRRSLFARRRRSGGRAKARAAEAQPPTR